MRTLTHLLIGLLVVGFAVSLLAFSWLDVAPKRWDEAYLLTLPTKLTLLVESGDAWGAVVEYYSGRLIKPPLSMLGTTASMLVVGRDALGWTMDNLLVALLLAYLVRRFLAHDTSPLVATTVAACLLTTPYCLAFSRNELAELYVLALTVLFYCYLLRRSPPDTAGRSALAGAIGGLGVAAKLSFPLVAGPLALWVYSAAALRARRDGTVARVLGRGLLAAVVCVGVVALTCGTNWKHMWRHLRAQYGWVGEQYGGGEERLSVDFLQSYAFAEGQFAGWIWVGAFGLLLLLWPLCGRKKASQPEPNVTAHTAAPSASRIAPLLVTLLANLGYCYFFPVVDPRFTIGALVAFVLLFGLLAGRVLRERPLAEVLACAVFLVLNLAFLGANTFVPARPDRGLLACELPGIGRLPAVLAAPNREIDQRGPALAAAGPDAKRIGLAGDHPSLNIDNLRLHALVAAHDVDFVQIGYLGAQLEMQERLAKAGPVDAWIVCLTPDEAAAALWTQKLGSRAAELLDADPGLKRAAWTAKLADGSEVRVYRHATPR